MLIGFAQQRDKLLLIEHPYSGAQKNTNLLSETDKHVILLDSQLFLKQDCRTEIVTAGRNQ